MNYRLILLVAALVIGIWFFFIRQSSVEAQEGYFHVGQEIQIPYPDEPNESFSLLILQVNDTGEFFFMDPDRDVFRCLGEINERSCSFEGMTCPPGVRTLSRIPKFKDNLLLSCMSWSDITE